METWPWNHVISGKPAKTVAHYLTWYEHSNLTKGPIGMHSVLIKWFSHIIFLHNRQEILSLSIVYLLLPANLFTLHLNHINESLNVLFCNLEKPTYFSSSKCTVHSESPASLSVVLCHPCLSVAGLMFLYTALYNAAFVNTAIPMSDTAKPNSQKSISRNLV